MSHCGELWMGNTHGMFMKTWKNIRKCMSCYGNFEVEGKSKSTAHQWEVVRWWWCHIVAGRLSWSLMFYVVISSSLARARYMRLTTNIKSIFKWYENVLRNSFWPDIVLVGSRSLKCEIQYSDQSNITTTSNVKIHKIRLILQQNQLATLSVWKPKIN